MTTSEKPRVFCVGFQKTGTTSLGRALRMLGYKNSGYRDFEDFAESTDPNLGDALLERAKKLMAERTGFKDTPWPLFYKEADALYPGSKFIHVVRDEDRWIQSVVRDFAEFPNAIHGWIYGENAKYPKGNEEIYLARYREHNAEVREYFAGREDDYLPLTLKEVNWEAVCGFLGHDVPDEPWPHLNTREDKSRRMVFNQMRKRVKKVVSKIRGGS